MTVSVQWNDVKKSICFRNGVVTANGAGSLFIFLRFGKAVTSKKPRVPLKPIAWLTPFVLLSRWARIGLPSVMEPHHILRICSPWRHRHAAGLLSSNGLDVERNIDLARLLKDQCYGNLVALLKWGFQSHQHQVITARRE